MMETNGSIISLPHYKLYTDGSSFQLEGSWGYAIILDERLVREDARYFEEATNNRAELLAVINGLKQFKKDSKVEVISDSAYIVNCFLQKWYEKWRKNGWYASSGPVKNKGLWIELLTLVAEFRIPITWTHIRGHNGDKWNEYVDKLCGTVRLQKGPK